MQIVIMCCGIHIYYVPTYAFVCPISLTLWKLSHKKQQESFEVHQSQKILLAIPFQLHRHWKPGKVKIITEQKLKQIATRVMLQQHTIHTMHQVIFWVKLRLNQMVILLLMKWPITLQDVSKPRLQHGLADK